MMLSQTRSNRGLSAQVLLDLRGGSSMTKPGRDYTVDDSNSEDGDGNDNRRRWPLPTITDDADDHGDDNDRQQ